MNVWFTSDAHINHNAVAHHRRHAWLGNPQEFDDEVEKDAEIIAWHNDLLAENWDSQVHKDDLVYVMGDISSGSAGGQRAALEWFAARPGRKRLTKGNHDGPFAQNQDRHKWYPAYHEVFETVEDYGRYKIAGHKVMLSHFPYTGDHGDHDRYQQYRLRPIDLPIIHGHTHSNKAITYAIAPKGMPLLQIHVGVDAWDFRPVHIDEVIEILKENTLT